jgi:proteasome assembly chaperone (PAC2) family protein
MAVRPHAGMSIAVHSPRAENEVLLHHGAHVEYHKSDVPYKDKDGNNVHVHHVTVHSDHQPLEKYGKYLKP